MADFVVHLVPGSPFARAVLVALEEKHAPYRLQPLGPGASKQPEHLARHPFGRVPVLEHDGFMLYETQAILRYIDRVLPEPALTPADPQAAARMDQVMNISDWYLFQGVNNVIGFHRIVAPRLFGAQPDEAAIAAAMPQGHKVMGVLSGTLGDQPFFGGAALSLADILVAPQFEFLSMTPEWQALSADWPNLTRWLEAMRSRASMQATTIERLLGLAAGGSN